MLGGEPAPGGAARSQTGCPPGTWDGGVSVPGARLLSPEGSPRGAGPRWEVGEQGRGLGPGPQRPACSYPWSRVPQVPSLQTTDQRHQLGHPRTQRTEGLPGPLLALQSPHRLPAKADRELLCPLGWRGPRGRAFVLFSVEAAQTPRSGLPAGSAERESVPTATGSGSLPRRRAPQPGVLLARQQLPPGHVEGARTGIQPVGPHLPG